MEARTVCVWGKGRSSDILPSGLKKKEKEKLLASIIFSCEREKEYIFDEKGNKPCHWLSPNQGALFHILISLNLFYVLMMRFLLSLSYSADEQTKAQKATLPAQCHTAREQQRAQVPGRFSPIPEWWQAPLRTPERPKKESKPYPGTTPKDISLYFSSRLCIDIFKKFIGEHTVYSASLNISMDSLCSKKKKK